MILLKKIIPLFFLSTLVFSCAVTCQENIFEDEQEELEYLEEPTHNYQSYLFYAAITGLLLSSGIIKINWGHTVPTLSFNPLSGSARISKWISLSIEGCAESLGY